jgi:hypothetical protein
MKYDPYNVSHPSGIHGPGSAGIPLAYQAATHDRAKPAQSDPDFGQDFAAAEEARAEELSRTLEAEADQASQAEAERYQDWAPCQMYGHNFGPDGCLDCGEDF